MITKELQDTLEFAVKETAKRRHEYLTLEHLLYALLKEKTTSDVIVNCGGDVKLLKTELEKILTSNMEQLPGPDQLKAELVTFVLHSMMGLPVEEVGAGEFKRELEELVDENIEELQEGGDPSKLTRAVTDFLMDNLE